MHRCFPGWKAESPAWIGSRVESASELCETEGSLLSWSSDACGLGNSMVLQIGLEKLSFVTLKYRVLAPNIRRFPILTMLIQVTEASGECLSESKRRIKTADERRAQTDGRR